MELPFTPPLVKEEPKSDGLPKNNRPPGLVVYRKPRQDTLSISWPGVHINIPMMLTAEGVDVDWDEVDKAVGKVLKCFKTSRGNTLYDVYNYGSRRSRG